MLLSHVLHYHPDDFFPGDESGVFLPERVYAAQKRHSANVNPVYASNLLCGVCVCVHITTCNQTVCLCEAEGR